MVPIYRQKIPNVAWQLLMWLICHMDEQREVRGSWRTRAAEDIGANRRWLSECADQLLKVGLIETKTRVKWVRVNTDQLFG